MTPHTVREIAQHLDIPPHDALDLVRKAGVLTCWHDGEAYIGEYLDAYLARDHRYDPVPELEFDANSQQMAVILESELEQCISDLRVEASQNDVIPVDSPNLRRLLACGKLLQGAAA